MNAPRGQPSKREVRRFQWSLRLLLLFTALCAIGVRVCLVPYWREASTARWLAEIGAGTRIAISGPKWLRPITGDRYLERTVHINFLPDCDICDDDLASLRWLSRLETVSFHDAPLGDRGLEHLGRVSSLCGLDLEGTSVSDAGLRHVERLPHLRELRLRRTRVSLRQMEHLARKRPELSIDLALGDNVYRSTSNALQSRHAPIHEVLFRCDANEEWNLLWTKSQGASSEKAAQRAAKRQRASWLEEYLTQVKERDRANATRSSAVDIAALEAALMETQIALARLDDDAEALSLARHRGSKAAKRLLELLADEFEDGLAEPFSFGCVRDLATRLLLSDAANRGDAERRLTIIISANVLDRANQQAACFVARSGLTLSLAGPTTREVLQMRFDLWALGLAVVGGVAMFVTKPARSANDDTNKVLRHMVMYKFKDNLPPADLKEVVDTFAGLPKKIDTIIGFEHGTNVSREGKSDGLTHCFVVTFRDEKGLATYLDHPAHQHYVEVARDRREKVVVFDYWATK